MIGRYVQDWARSWNLFWFVLGAAETLAIMRISVGSMLLYIHLVWTLDLLAFFGLDGVLPSAYRNMLPDGTGFLWSHIDWSASMAWLWGMHLAAFVVYGLFTIGLFTRITAWLSFLFVVSYANRATGTLFGLDQIVAFLTFYLAIGNSGHRFSLDAIGQKGEGKGPACSVRNTIATRLIQLHMCVVYLFAGLGKLQGISWWNGEAIWGALASREYQTLDLTWLSDHMWAVNLLTLVTVAWEVSYPCLVWPRLTRPIVLVTALLVHLGIGLAMGMMTFGLIMIIGNAAFIPPQWFRSAKQE